MRIGMYSDDRAGLATALLIARGLATLGEPVRVLAELPAELPSQTCENVSCSGVATTADEILVHAGEMSSDPYSHLIVVLPLASLAECKSRSLLDAVLTAGRDHPASARAMRVARYETGLPTAVEVAHGNLRTSPAWFVPCSHQVDLRTQATLASTGAVSLPFSTRTVPFMVPRLDMTDLADLVAPNVAATALQTAVLLASIVVAIGADPHARRIEAANLAALMVGRDTERERLISDRLRALAAEFERLDVPPTQEKSQRVSFPPARRHLQPSTCSGHRPSRRPDYVSSRSRFGVR